MEAQQPKPWWLEYWYRWLGGAIFIAGALMKSQTLLELWQTNTIMLTGICLGVWNYIVNFEIFKLICFFGGIALLGMGLSIVFSLIVPAIASASTSTQMIFGLSMMSIGYLMISYGWAR